MMIVRHVIIVSNRVIVMVYRTHVYGGFFFKKKDVKKKRKKEKKIDGSIKYPIFFRLLDSILFEEYHSFSILANNTDSL